MHAKVVILLAAAALAAAAPPKSADALFEAGDFAAAGRAFDEAVRASPGDAHAVLGQARMAFYGNRLDEAEAAARRAKALAPADPAIDGLLREIDRRRTLLDPAAAPAVPRGGVRLPFLESEPLPLVRLKVNGRDANLLIDTGGGDLTLDPDFVQALGLQSEAAGSGVFAGGRSAELRRTRVETVEAGPIVLHGLSATIIPVRAAHLYKTREVDGVIGTAFLARFLSTLDYPDRALVLRPRGTRSGLLGGFGGTAVPIWWVGDHFLFARGAVNTLTDQLFLVDSGGAGVGFAPEADTVKAARITAHPDQRAQGVGGGGAVEVIPTLADRVCLGSVCQENVAGLYTPQGSPLSHFPFHAAGIVSHGFLRRYAVTFDLDHMRLLLAEAPQSERRGGRGRR